MPELVMRLPLFPLGLVLLPSELVPLHIFEERYKLMIGECLEQESEFGIVWLSDSGLREVGCSARVERVLERLEDGRMNILVRGTRPFRLLRRIEHLPYPAGVVELLDDRPDEPAALEKAAGRARERYADLVERVRDERPASDEVAALGAYEMAGRVDFELGAKQALLEARSEAGRLDALAELIGVAMQRLDYAERASEQARSNGHLRR